MHDGGGHGVADCGHEPRWIVAAWRRTRGKVVAGILIAGALALLLATWVWKPPVRLVWNVSASAPVGLYRVRSGRPLDRKDWAIARTPEPFRTLAASRGYVPSNVPLVKRVAAVDNDLVCASGDTIRINGRVAATRRRQDLEGRPMPWWTGCVKLREGDVFLLMSSRWSFDGRYFGITRGRDPVGRAELLWAL